MYFVYMYYGYIDWFCFNCFKVINRESFCGLFDIIWILFGVCGNVDVGGGRCWCEVVCDWSYY